MSPPRPDGAAPPGLDRLPAHGLQRIPAALQPALEALVRVVTAGDSDRMGLTAEVAHAVGEALQPFPAHLRGGLLAGLATFEQSTRARPSSRGRPFSRLPLDAAERAFAAWWHSPIFPVRQWAKGIKGLVALAYWDHPTVRQSIGFHPEAWIAHVAQRRQGDYAADIAAHAERVLAPSPVTEWTGGGSAGGAP